MIVDDKFPEDRIYEPAVVKRYQEALSVLEAGDTLSAIRLFNELAAEGVAPAYTCLGSIYRKGQGVDKCARKAMEYYWQGVKLGDTGSIVCAAALFASGALGVVKHDFALQFITRPRGAVCLSRCVGWGFTMPMESTLS
jgi:TPR repeat protein